MTLTLTLDLVIRHTVMHKSSTSTYIPNFIETVAQKLFYTVTFGTDCEWSQSSLLPTKGIKYCDDRIGMYTVPQKTSHLWLAITLTHVNGFWYFGGRNITDKVGNQTTLYYATSNTVQWLLLQVWRRTTPTFYTATDTVTDLANTEHVGNRQQDAMLLS